MVKTFFYSFSLTTFKINFTYLIHLVSSFAYQSIFVHNLCLLNNYAGPKKPSSGKIFSSFQVHRKNATQTENGITIHGSKLLVPGSKRGSLRYQDNSAMRFTKFNCDCFEATRKQPKAGKLTKTWLS